MKVTLEFDLPDEKDLLKQMQNGPDAFAVLWDFSMWLGSEREYGEHGESGDGVLEKVIKKFYDLLQERSVDLE